VGFFSGIIFPIEFFVDGNWGKIFPSINTTTAGELQQLGGICNLDDIDKLDDLDDIFLS